MIENEKANKNEKESGDGVEEGESYAMETERRKNMTQKL
jgi:hypothetical protein